MALRERLTALSMRASPSEMIMHKCPCGHISCNQYIMSGQHSVGFDEADASLMRALWNAWREGLLVTREEHEQVLREIVDRATSKHSSKSSIANFASVALSGSN